MNPIIGLLVGSYRWILLWIFLVILSVFYSKGWHHPDEHYQIIEWAWLKFQNLTPEYLAWEYERQIRSWFQPFLVLQIFRLGELFGVTSSDVQMILVRLFHAILGISVILYLCRHIELFVKSEYRRIAQIMIFSNYALPYLIVRGSSENLGSLLSITGTVLFVSGLHHRRWVSLALAGLVFAFAFQARFQMGLWIAGLGTWALIYHHSLWRMLAIAILSFVLGTAIGAAIDFWGYGTWQFTAWEYLWVNLAEGKAASFGVKPWYWYFTRMSSYGFAPITLVWTLSMIGTWFYCRRSPLAWISFFFYVGHSLLSHKELRFIFPIVPLIPLSLVLMASHWRSVEALLKRPRWTKIWVTTSVIVAGFSVTMPAGDIGPFLEHVAVSTKRTGYLIYTPVQPTWSAWHQNPDGSWSGYRPRFYERTAERPELVTDPQAISGLQRNSFTVVSIDGALEASLVDSRSCEMIASRYSRSFYENARRLFKLMPNSHVYECRR